MDRPARNIPPVNDVTMAKCGNVSTMKNSSIKMPVRTRIRFQLNAVRKKDEIYY